MYFRLWLLLSFLALGRLISHAEEVAEPERVIISGRVVDENSEGVSDVSVRGIVSNDESQTTTDAQGHFSLEVIEKYVTTLRILVDDPGGDRMGIFIVDWRNPPDRDSLIEIPLLASRKFSVEVVTAAGDAAAHSRVGVIVSYSPLVQVETDKQGKAVLRVPTGCEIQSFFASKENVGFDYRAVDTNRDKAYQAKWMDEAPIRFSLASSQSVKIQLRDYNHQPVEDCKVGLWLLSKPGEPSLFNLGNTPIEFQVITNKVGVAEFQGIPDWDLKPLTFWADAEDFVRTRITYQPKEHPGKRMTKKLYRLVPMSGQVRFADGRPAEGMKVRVRGGGYEPSHFVKEVMTDRAGKFELKVAPNMLYALAIIDKEYSAPLLDGFAVFPGDVVEGLGIELRKATRVFGRVTSGAEKTPVVGQTVTLQQASQKIEELEGIELPNPQSIVYPQDSLFGVQPSIYRSVVTDDDGRYEYYVGPGLYVLNGHRQVDSSTVRIEDDAEVEINIAAPRADRGKLIGRVIDDETGNVVSGASVFGIYQRSKSNSTMQATTDREGEFQISRELFKGVLCARSEDLTRAGCVEIEEDQDSATIRLKPVASARGKLFDRETKQPMKDRKIQFDMRIQLDDYYALGKPNFGDVLTTDNEGRFVLEHLVVGQQYNLNSPRGNGTFDMLTDFTVSTPGVIELGDLELALPYEPPTFEERMEEQLSVEELPIVRFREAVKDATSMHQHLLVVFVERGTELTSNWFSLRFGSQKVRKALSDFQILHISKDSKGAGKLADELGVAFENQPLPAWWFGNIKGEKLHVGPIAQGDSGIDEEEVVDNLARYAPERLDAEEILQDALVEAEKSDRLVIVIESNTRSEAARKLSRFLDSQREILEKDYLWVEIDQRWKHSKEVLEEIYPDKRSRIPWFAIVDSNKGLMATSDGPRGNIGFPQGVENIEHFMVMLESTILRMTGEDLEVLREELETE